MHDTTCGATPSRNRWRQKEGGGGGRGREGGRWNMVCGVHRVAQTMLHGMRCASVSLSSVRCTTNTVKNTVPCAKTADL